MPEPDPCDGHDPNASSSQPAGNEGLTGPDGVLLDEYVLLEQLSSSRTGLVYKARHRLMGRMVAIKFLTQQAAASESLTGRFQRAIKILSRLEHKNLTRAFEAGHKDGKLYLVMEYVDGQDLRSTLKQRGPLAVETAVDYVCQAAAGLAYAHEQGVWHRNIKPSNLLVDGEGVVKIVGFGLAHIEGGGAFNEASIGDGLTRQGQVMGTYDYMAPEQAIDSSDVDQRVDVYSLGCTLHSLITGHAPYVTKSPVKMVMAHRSSPIPSLADSRPEVPAALDRVFQRMLAKQPEDRYGSMNQVIEDLDAAISAPSAEETEPAEVEPVETERVEDSPAEDEPASSDTMTSLRRIAAVHETTEKAPEPPSPPPRKFPTAAVAAGVAVVGVILLALVWLVSANRTPVAKSTKRAGQTQQNEKPPARKPSSLEPQTRPDESSGVDASREPAPSLPSGTTSPADRPTPVDDRLGPAAKPVPQRTLESLMNTPNEPVAPAQKAPPEAVVAEIRPAPKPVLLPVPDEAARRKATELLRDTFPDEFSESGTDAQKAAFAQRLLKQAAEISGDPAGRFVLLETVRKLAMELHDPVTGLEAVDLTGEYFEVDPWAMRVELLTAMSEGPHSTAQRQHIGQQAARLIPEALKVEQFEVADQLGKVAMSEAVRVRDVPVIHQVRSTSAELEKLLDLFRQYQAGESRLKAAPEDAEAKLSVGRYECLVRGDWDAGLPKLAAASDASMSELAAKDLAKPDGLDQQVAVGDGWWDLAQSESGTVQANLYRRAAYWYEKAASKATGLMKTKLDMRLKTIRSSLPETSRE